MTGRLIDLDARRRAATDFDTNLVVTAGAGTGKTSLLIERILNACVGEGIDLTALAAITFTEKAAAQLRDRLFTALERLRSFGLARRGADHPGSDEADRAWRYLRGDRGLGEGRIAERALDCLESLDQARIGTIHSLCADLLRRYPREAGIDPGFAVDDGTVTTRLAEQVWEEWLASEMEATGTRADLWEEILSGIRIGTLRSLGLALAGCTPPWDPVTDARHRDAAMTILKERAAGLVPRIDAILGAASGMNPNCERQLLASRGWLQVFVTAGPAGLPGDLGRDEVRKSPTPGKHLAGVAPEEVKTVMAASGRLLDACLQVDPFADRCLQLLGSFAADFRDRFAASGYLSYEDLLVGARDLLRDHPGVRRREKERFRAILVDEFQDTDPLQYEIVFFLSEDAGSTARDVAGLRFENGKLFIVGDPKQSIYRFRGADIEAYRLAVDRILETGGIMLLLETNFRSPAGILEPLNDLFEASFDRASPEQAEYRRIVASGGGDGDGPRVRIWSVPVEENDRSEQRRRREGRAIAAWIREQVTGGRNRWRDVALLFRAMTPIDLYLRPLREAGIPFVVEGGGTFSERSEVRGFLSLLKLMANPNDAVSLLAVLRSPIGGVTDPELARHAAAGRDRWRLDAAVNARECPAIADCLQALRRVRAAVRPLPPDAAVVRVLEEMNLLELNGAAFEGGQRVANLMKLADRVAIRAREERLSLYETVRALERELDAGGRREPESPLADEALDAVRILTVHKAKGLEFPVVILPDLTRSARGPRTDGDDIRWVKLGGGRQAIAVRVGRRCGPAINPAEAVSRDITPQHDAAERIRTFYVAATRAREELVMVATPSRSGPWIDCLEAWGYSWSGGEPPAATEFHHGRVGHEIRAPIAAATRLESGLPPPAELAAAVDRFRQWREGAERCRGRQWIVSPSALTGRTHAEDRAAAAPHPPVPATGGGAVADRIAPAAGIAVHRLLQLWDRRDPAWFRTRMTAAAGYGAGEAGADPEPVASLVEEILDRFLASELPRRLQDIDIIGREIPIEASDRGLLLHGMIDLLYRRGGNVVVADFKTDAVAPGRESELLERYDAQLSAYARAVGRALSLRTPAAREIWSIRTGSIVTCPEPLPPE